MNHTLHQWRRFACCKWMMSPIHSWRFKYQFNLNICVFSMLKWITTISRCDNIFAPLANNIIGFRNMWYQPSVHCSMTLEVIQMTLLMMFCRHVIISHIKSHATGTSMIMIWIFKIGSLENWTHIGQFQPFFHNLSQEPLDKTCAALKPVYILWFEKHKYMADSRIAPSQWETSLQNGWAKT